MEYNPRNPESQAMLASSLLYMLHGAGFTEESRPRTVERVFSREVSDDLRVVVFTTINPRHGIVRGRGRDAIRVCVLRRCTDGRDRGVSRQTRVNRVGQIQDIVDRTKERMRDAWRSVRTLNRCGNCGAPKFISKKGNPVCSELCWI